MDQWRLHVSEDEMLCESPAGAVRCDDVLGCRYLVMRYFDSMTLFDERFVDYGCNKVQWVDQLRLMGYEFYLLGRAFMMDIVHHE